MGKKKAYHMDREKYLYRYVKQRLCMKSSIDVKPRS